MGQDAAMPESVPDAALGARLDRVFDPARPLPGARSTMAWEAPGVVVDDEHGTFIPRGPFRIRTMVLWAAALGVPLAALTMLIPGGSVPAGMTALVLVGVVLGLLLLVNALVSQARRMRRAYAPAWAWLAVMGGMGLIVALGIVGVFPIRLAMLAPMMMLGLAMTLILPLRRRQGDDLRCAGCDYAYSYTDPDGARAPDACSECGRAWHSPGGLVRGTRVRLPAARGVAVVALVGLLMAFSMMRTPMLRLLPTGTLISMVTQRGAGFVMDEWAQLRTRTLSEAQRLRLSRALIDLRLDEQSLDRDADNWLDAEATAGRLPPDLLDRYHREMFDATLSIPDRIVAGVAFEVGLDTRQRGYSFGPRDVLIAFDGVVVDDHPDTILGRQGRLLHASLAGVESTWLGSATASAYAPRALVTIDAPGRRRIACTYWVIVVPRFTQPTPITWSPDGTPTLPPEALFSERRRLEVQVEVLPALVP